MNSYIKLAASLASGLMFYAILTIGVWQKWWLPDVLLTAIYGGMTATGLMGGVHYGARYLTYTPTNHIGESAKKVAPAKPRQLFYPADHPIHAAPKQTQATQEAPQ